MGETFYSTIERSVRTDSYSDALRRADVAALDSKILLRLLPTRLTSPSIRLYIEMLTSNCASQPYRGTGWAAGAPPPGHGPAQYTGAPPQPYFANDNQAPPVYSPPISNQGYYNQGHEQNQGYFGGQQQGLELQQPESAYAPQRGGDPVYAPPTGPPPGKKGGDGIIR